MDILCNDCIYNNKTYCSRSRVTFPKATTCVDYRAVHWKKKKDVEVQKEFFTYSEGDKPQCVAYAYLP